MAEARGEAPAPASRELRLRVFSALVLAAAVLGVTALGGWPFRLMWAVVAGLIAHEWLRMAGIGWALPAAGLTALAGIAAGLLPASTAAFVGLSVMLATAGAWRTAYSRGPLPLGLCGLAYALPIAVVVPALRDLPAIGGVVIVWTFAVVWLTDIAAFFAGRRFGGPKLMPSVSPKKTWSGALGGTIAGMLGGLAVWWLAGRFGTPVAIGGGVVLGASLLASILGQAGDLFESHFKRRFGAKDSGSLIPGHGGFMDRLDAYWAVIVFAGAAFLVARAWV